MPLPSPAETVKARWLRLAAALDLPADLTAQAWSGLETAYTEPHRSYHTLTHIEAVLAGLDRHRDRFDDPQMAELALFFHDFVYNPAHQDNEARSAAHLRDLFTGHVKEYRLFRAGAHIEATRHHDATADADTNLILDLDMSILGAPWPDYLAYAKGVHAEYAPVYGAEAYALGRVTLFIEPTLAKSRIFVTEPFADLETPTRDNLARERALLQAPQPFDTE